MLHLPLSLLSLSMVCQGAPLLPDYRCQYDPESRELVCSCSRSSLLLPSLSSLTAEWPGRRIERVTISSCGSLDLSLSTVELPHPLAQVTIGSVDYLTLRGVEVSPESEVWHTLRIHISGVAKQANIMGRIHCSHCSNTSDPGHPGLEIQVTDSPLLMLQSLTLEDVNLRLKTRNVGQVRVVQSDLSNMEANSFEVFYSKKLELKDSIFSHPEPGVAPLVLNHVANFQLNHVLGLSNTSYTLLSNDTQLTVSCTSPAPTSPWDTQQCGPLPPHTGHVSSAQGVWHRTPVVAKAVTVVSMLVLSVAILTILTLHKRGKLDSLL